ncbi:MFS transporter [Rhodococcus sp. 15-649-2-2]|uniref:MFS transporter n=1 Tax=Rhodococcus sp. 15-649-2-2 TaxID=2023140 RepID=UPI00211AF30C|nr:MFS transporter [Rhodococcus sp. 15-649-2-2]
MTESHKDSDRRKKLGGAIGEIGTQFDYSVYALMAPTIAIHFFPAGNPAAAILGTFAVYALSFVARPFGGALFGYVGDKFGRLAVLSWTVVLMGVGTMLIGMIPTYESIGLAATLILILCRLLQGLSIGGETTGVESYIVESAPATKRASWMGTVKSFSYWPVAAVAAIIFGLRSALGEEAFEAWGWRIPFILGGVVAVVGYVLRRTLEDPDEFVEAAAEYEKMNTPENAGTVSGAMRGAFGTRKSMLLVILLQPPYAIGAYLLSGYMYTFVVSHGGIPATSALLSNMAAIMVLAALLPVMGKLCDRLGRKPMYYAGAIWLFVAAYPAFALAGSGTVAGAFVGQALLSIGLSMYGAAMFTGMVEIFPTALRCRGHGISYNLSVALFGGTTPLIAAALISATGNPVAPAFYAMAGIGLIGLVGVWLVPETKNTDLRSSVYGLPSSAVPGRTDETDASDSAKVVHRA